MWPWHGRECQRLPLGFKLAMSRLRTKLTAHQAGLLLGYAAVPLSGVQRTWEFEPF